MKKKYCFGGNAVAENTYIQRVLHCLRLLLKFSFLNLISRDLHTHFQPFLQSFVELCGLRLQKGRSCEKTREPQKANELSDPKTVVGWT